MNIEHYEQPILKRTDKWENITHLSSCSWGVEDPVESGFFLSDPDPGFKMYRRPNSQYIDYYIYDIDFWRIKGELHSVTII